MENPIKELQEAFIAPVIKRVFEILKEKGYIDDKENKADTV